MPPLLAYTSPLGLPGESFPSTGVVVEVADRVEVRFCTTKKDISEIHCVFNINERITVHRVVLP